MSSQANIREEELKNRMDKFLAILAAFAAFNAAAVGFNVGALPDPAFIDTENSTNICFAAERPTWLFSRDWNIVEVVRRGDGQSSGWCEVSRECTPEGLFLGCFSAESLV